MSPSTWRGRLTDDDAGVSADVVLTIDMSSPLPLPPPPPPIEEPNRAVIGGATLPIAGINTAREAGQLVLYRNPVTITPTNRWGVEVTVSEFGMVSGYRNRQQETETPDIGTGVPSGGVVLSGHGAMADALRQHAVLGTAVKLARSDEPLPPSATGAYPAKEIAVYKMMWSSNGPRLADIHPAFNVIRLAFAQGDPPRMVGWGSQGEASFRSEAAMMIERGVRFTLSLGGAGGHVALSTSGIKSIKDKFNRPDDATLKPIDLHGVDIDVEASALDPVRTLVFMQACRDEFGPTFGISMAPNGTNVSQYLPIAAAAHRAGCLDSYGQQFYDVPVSELAATGRIRQALDAGLPISKIGVGMMIGSDVSRYWTNVQCAERVRNLRGLFPGLSRVYLWEASRGGTSQFAVDMKTIIG